jgi:hypothetical protein
MFSSQEDSKKAREYFGLLPWPEEEGLFLEDLEELFPLPEPKKSKYSTLLCRRGKKEFQIKLKYKPAQEFKDLQKAFQESARKDPRLRSYTLRVGYKFSPSSHYLVMIALLDNYTHGPLYPVTLKKENPSFQEHFQRNLKKILRAHPKVKRKDPSQIQILKSDPRDRLR